MDELAECAKNLNLAPALVRKHVEENFSVERMVDDYILLYSQLLSSGQSEMEPERSVA